MRAVAVEKFGDGPRLIELPDPTPAAGEILVRLRAASLNPLDSVVAAGYLAQQYPNTFPLVLGFDGAGEVAAVGDGVERFAPGDAVFGQFWSEPLGRGTFAELVALPARSDSGALLPLPPTIPLQTAAALPTAGQTAFGVIAALAPAAGETLLVVGATGGVGSLAVQLAARRGARVIATARADAAEWIVGLGAAETIDYGAGPLPEMLAAAHPEGVDALLDLTGDRALVSACAPQVRDGGRLTSIGFGAPEELLAETRIEVSNYENVDKPRLLAGIADEVVAGNVAVEIQREIELAMVPAALGAPGGARGKTVVLIESDR
jgi:NADPH2:quinone reductase